LNGNAGETEIVTFCSKWCEQIYDREPHRFQTPGYYRHYNDWQLGDLLRDQELLRPDGKLIGQPRLDTLGTDDMWTIDDIDSFGIPFSMLLTEEDLKDPMIPHAAQ
ncbi:MAG TPA: hypothetical protein VJ456_01145, partial [Acidimicrobiia bacterium]|nr:hypothetical protein [Acidimicrobiia bacterium]